MTELTHYGVPGMKWGVRRSQATLDRKAGRKALSDKNYNKSQRTADKRSYGKLGVKRIEKRVGKGRSVQSARRREVGARIATGLIAGTVANVTLNAIANPDAVRTLGNAVLKDADRALRNRVARQNASFAAEGAKAAASIFSDSRGLTSLNTISLNPSEYTRTK